VAFSNDYHEIIAMGIVKILQPTSLKLIKGRWEKIYLSKEKVPAVMILQG